MAEIDAVFKAYDIRGVYPTEVDEDLAWKIGHASAQFLRSLLSGYDRGQASANRLVVGRDMRPHSAPPWPRASSRASPPPAPAAWTWA